MKTKLFCILPALIAVASLSASLRTVAAARRVFVVRLDARQRD